MNRTGCKYRIRHYQRFERSCHSKENDNNLYNSSGALKKIEFLFFVLFYFVLFYFVLFYFILFCFVLFCFVLFLPLYKPASISENLTLTLANRMWIEKTFQPKQEFLTIIQNFYFSTLGSCDFKNNPQKETVPSLFLFSFLFSFLLFSFF